MKVGVHVRDLAPEMGGGHTYESDILAALAEARGSAGHEIVALGYGPEPPHGWDAGSYVSLGASLGGKVSGKIRRKIAAATAPKGAAGPKTRVDSIITASGIDLIWCLAAGAPTRNFPYVTTIWDLQHRIQPIFPEVSACEEWANR